MKNKDDNWYNDKLKDIKKRKKFVNKIEDVKIRKKLKNDLKREQRGAKHSVKNNLKKWIDDEIEGFND
jgi:hypothetical protein